MKIQHTLAPFTSQSLIPIILGATALMMLSGCEPVYYDYPAYYDDPHPTVVVDHVHNEPAAPNYTPVSVSVGCDDLPEAGRCAGETLQFCHEGEVFSYYCPDYQRVCAWDDDYAWFECLPPSEAGTPPVSTPPVDPPTPVDPPVDPPVDSCGSITSDGQCDGDALTYCEDGAIVRTDCAADGRICTFDTDNDYYSCVTPEVIDPPADPCEGVTFEGMCDGDNAVWCEDEALQSKSCANGCGFDETNGFYDCVASEDDCGDVTFEGMCEDGAVFWCDDGSLQTQTCDSECGFDEAEGYYTCFE